MADGKGAIGKYDILSKGSLETWEEFIKLAKDAHAELLEIVKTGPALNKDLADVKWAEQLNTSVKDVVNNIEKLIKVEKQLDAINNKLLGGEEKAIEQKRREKEARNAVKEAQRKETEEKRKAEKATKDLERAEKAAARAAEKAYKERIRYANHVSREQAKAVREQMKFNDELDKFATKSKRASGTSNSLSSSFGVMAKNMGTAVLAYTGITAVLDRLMSTFSSIVDNTKALNTLDFSMKAIIKDNIELTQTQNYLDKITQDYGLNLIDTTNAYIKFRAAVGTSNMTVKEGQSIFQSVSKASAVLGLTQEKTNLVFLALEQMASKGLISSEELRRQMGEQMPVAMASMAKALQIVTKEGDGSVAFLLKFMKQGKVLSDEVLPQFAIEMEKALGIETINRVDTLVSAQTRLNNSWIEFVEKLKAAKPLIAAYNSLASAMQIITEAITPDEDKVSKKQSDILGTVMTKLDGVTDKEERRKILTEEYVRLQKEQIKVNDDLAKSEENRSNKVFVGLSMLNRGLGLSGNFTAAADFETVYKDTVLDADAYAKVLSQIRKNFDDFVNKKAEEKTPREVDDTEAGKDLFPDKLRIFKNNLDAKLAIYKEHLENMHAVAYRKAMDSGLSEVEVTNTINGLKMDEETQLYEFKLNQLNELLVFTKANGKETSDVEKEIAELKAGYASTTTDFIIKEEERYHDKFMKDKEDELKKLQDVKDANLAGIEGRMQEKLLALQAQATDQSKGAKYDFQFGLIDEKLVKDSIQVIIDGYSEMLNVEDLTAQEIESISKNLFDAKKSLYEAEREEIERTAQERLDKEKAIMDFSIDSMSKMFDIFSGFQSARMEQLDWNYEREMNLAGESMDKKLAVENEYNKEKRKLERRQAIINKAQAAFNVIVNTWQGVMSAASTVVTLPLVPFIKAMGALSLAAVLATPIPKYEKGGKHKGGTAIFSEQGQELFIPNVGKPFLTPKKETIANMPAGEFIPHDETQRILAQGAMNNFIKEAAEVNFGPTNKILSKIASKEETNYSNGYKITNKNNIFGRYVTRN